MKIYLSVAATTTALVTVLYSNATTITKFIVCGLLVVDFCVRMSDDIENNWKDNEED